MALRLSEGQGHTLCMERGFVQHALRREKEKKGSKMSGRATVVCFGMRTALISVTTLFELAL